MSLKEDLKDLLDHQIIDPQTAQKIKEYYHHKAGEKSSRLLIVFAVLGTFLIGAGILLLIAHNWSQFPRSIKSILAFIPLLISQSVGLYVLFQKSNIKFWTESVSIAISFGLIIALALVSQIYHIQESSSQLVFWWVILSIPLVYLFKSKSLGLFLFVLSAYYLLQNFHSDKHYLYLLLWLLLWPFYYGLEKKHLHDRTSLFLYFYRWTIAISLLLFVFSFFSNRFSLLTLVGVLSIYYLIGENILKERNFFKNPYKWIGILGILGLFIFSSFNFFWEKKESLFTLQFQWVPELVLLILVVLGYLYLIIKRKKTEQDLPYFSFLFVFFILIYLSAYFFDFTYIFGILSVLIISLNLIVQGERKKRLDILNLGLVSFFIFIITHFFSNDISFVYRGVAFILTGIVLIGINYYFLKNIKK